MAAFAVLLVVGCGSLPSRSELTPSGVAVPAIPTPGAFELPLDPESRDLLAIVGPDESMHLTVGTTWTTELSEAATAAGMRVEIFEAGVSLVIDGPLRPALDLIRTVPVTTVRVEDLRGAMRPIRAERPVVDVPVAGRPYLDIGFNGNLPEVAMVAPQREPMLRSLAEAIATIDGRPYATLNVSGGCGTDKVGALCRLVAIGFTAGAGGYEDDVAVVGAEARGWRGIVEPASVLRWSVPRSLLRAAEWIARHDDHAAALIGAYASCCVASWDLAKPGWITLEYERPCAAAIREFERQVADTGECSDRLRIAVDVGSRVVVSSDEFPGTG